MRLLGLACVAVIGCSFEGAPVTSETDSGVEDCSEWQSQFLDPCELGTANRDLTLDIDGTYVLNTTDNTFLDPMGAPVSVVLRTLDQNGTPATLIFAERIRLESGSSIRAIGARPVMLAANDILQVEGTIDASSRNGETLPGAGAAPCTTSEEINGVEVGTGGTGGTGGAGGSFALIGGNGGNATATDPDTLGGMAVPGPTLEVLRGGCPGGDGVGQLSLNMNDIGAGGAGGGAVLLAARNAVVVGGTISAGGSGGSAGLEWAGGGGGGSGGMIVLESPMVLVASSAAVFANGGGGGGASVHPGPTENLGSPGANAVIRATEPASGGDDGDHDHSANGGDGGFASQVSEDGENGQDSGGGGGGSVGLLFVLSTEMAIESSDLFPGPSTTF